MYETPKVEPCTLPPLEEATIAHLAHLPDRLLVAIMRCKVETVADLLKVPEEDIAFQIRGTTEKVKQELLSILRMELAQFSGRKG